MKCDVHILTSSKWSTTQYESECFASIAHEPVHVHALDAIDGKMGEARALGFSTGTAPYVSYLDSDDRVVPGTYQQCIDYLDEHPDIDIVFTLEERIDGEGQIIGESVMERKVHSIGRKCNPWTVRSLKYIHQIVVSRREAVESHLEFIKDWGGLADKALWAQQMLHGSRFALLPIVGHHWRQHSRTQIHRHLGDALQERYKALLDEVKKAFPG